MKLWNVWILNPLRLFMPRYRIPGKRKAAVKDRASYRCEYCRCLEKYSPQPYVIEHIIPLALNGTSEFDNLAFSCGGCNNHKYIKISAPDPVSGKSVPLFHPRKHQWGTHFKWDEEYLRMVGLTAIGRATIDALKLNRPHVVNFRVITKLTEEHPP